MKWEVLTQALSALLAASCLGHWGKGPCSIQSARGPAVFKALFKLLERTMY